MLAIPTLAVLTWIAGRRRWVALAVTAALGAAVFAADGFALSGAARPFPTVALLCVVALLAVVPLWWPRWARPVLRAWAAAVLTFAGWRSWSVLAQTYLPGHVPGGLGRGAVVALVGVGLGALVAEVYPFTRPKQAAAQVSSKMP